MKGTSIPRPCAECGTEFTGIASKKYCSDRCRYRVAERRKSHALRPSTLVAAGPTLDKLVETGIIEELHRGDITPTEAAKLIGGDRGQVTKSLNAWRRKKYLATKAEGWTRSSDMDEMLGKDLDEPIRQALADGNMERFEELLTVMVDRFADRFRPAFFRTKRGPYMTKGFHRNWIRAILKAIYTGGHILILSPPRHGKSELLIHFCVWIICRDFNITVIWIGGNVEPQARTAVGMVKAQLEHNEALIKAMLPPGETFKPQGRMGTQWRDDEFTIAQQDSEIVKASTMTAAGRGSKIKSMDADLIVADDIEDEDSTAQPAGRLGTRRWNTTQVESRKEEHTAYAYIGSRTHPDDLAHYLLQDEEWESIVDSAHAEWCVEPWDKAERHVDCVLFPELRSFKMIRGKRNSAQAQGLEHLFEMIWLNRPRPEGQTVFVEAEIRGCFNPNRGLGLTDDRDRRWAELPGDLKHIAGLDPSATGYQAGFAWAWSDETRKLYMLDLDNRHGGGIEEAFHLFREWHGTLDMAHWVVEENGFQRAILLDRAIKEWSALAGVLIEGSQTQGQNRNDPKYGVTSLVRLFRERIIDLPFLGEEAQEKVLAYMNQLVRFSDDTTARRRGLSDLPMASWFPMKHVYRWMRGAIPTHMAIDYDPVFPDFQPVTWDGS